MQTTKHILHAAVLTAAVCACTSAYASCSPNSIIGKWQDTYGTVATVTSATKGKASVAGIICNVPGTLYKLAITQVGSPPTAVLIAGRPPKTSACPVLHATLTYTANSCTTAIGQVTFNQLTLPDAWTNLAPHLSAERQQNPEMSQGLR